MAIRHSPMLQLHVNQNQEWTRSTSRKRNILFCSLSSVSWIVSCSVWATHTACETTACTTHTAETLTTTAAPTPPSWKVSDSRIKFVASFNLRIWVESLHLQSECGIHFMCLSMLVEFAKLIQTMWSSTSSEAVSPSEFKTQIQRYAPRFVGYK